MLNNKEVVAIGLATLVLAITISFLKGLEIFFYSLLTVFILILANVVAKKITSFYLGTDIELKLWEIKRYGNFLGIYWPDLLPLLIFLAILAVIIASSVKPKGPQDVSSNFMNALFGDRR